MTKVIPPFTGFTSETVQFLNELKENNYKEWFEERRQVYETQLMLPFKSLATALSPTMHNIDSLFELRPHRVISRIYRDTRFSKNKDPYKTCIWMNFQRSTTHWENFPGFFMELNEANYFYGMGLYSPKRKVMDNFRDIVNSDSANFARMTKAAVLNKGFSVEGEEYKRALPNNLPDEFQTWMNRKSVYVMKQLSHDEALFSEKLVEQIADDFGGLADLYHIFVEAATEH